jgi:heme exporter protein D
VSGPAGPGRPRLAAVPQPPPSSAPPPASEPVRREPAPNGVPARWVWLLAALFVLALAGLAAESLRAGRLARELAASEARAEAAEARIRAYDGYLSAVRARAGALRQAVDGLEGVLAADPADGPPRE